MVEIDLSYIFDFEQDEPTWTALMEEFGAREGVRVHLKQMTWDTAWAELFSYTAQGKGPHVSHIGNTWVSGLARMNSLRAFKPEEIAAVGGAWDFITPNWEMGLIPGDKNLWSIPWTGWIYVICYRRDLLEKTGIDPATAFESGHGARETVDRLVASSLKAPWLNPQLGVSTSREKLYASPRDLLHIAASWIWAAGGDFIDKNGTRMLFNSPQALEGLKDWLDIYRHVPDKFKGLSQQETLDKFSKGEAAAVLANIRRANMLIELDEKSAVRKNLGVASVTETPWTGGGSLVIWEHTRRNPAQERAAVELVKFLASKEINLRYQRAVGSMPARIDALKEIYPEGNPAREAVMMAATKGRAYYNAPIWRRIEHLLSEEMGMVVAEANENPSVESTTILHNHLDPLAQHLNVILGA